MKVMVAMSGGVDSSAAVQLLKEAGHECVGCMLKLSGNESEADARAAAERMGIPFYVFDCRAEFRHYVIDNFTSEYLAGRTPNPCIVCNRYLKFGLLMDRMRELGCEAMATGHYARIEERNGQFILRKAEDESKDQSYVLYRLNNEQLAHIIFPLGNMTKPQVRQKALEAGLANAGKHDSQDICFVPDGDYASVVEEYSGRALPEGEFTDKDGHKLGTHRGIIHYTIGQRRGLGISAAEPLYVTGLDVPGNRVILGSNDDLFTREVRVSDFHLIGEEMPEPGSAADRASDSDRYGDPALPSAITTSKWGSPLMQFRCSAKIRYHHREQPGTLFKYPDGSPCEALFVFDEPQRAVTPGQSLVLYDGDRVLGGGVIM